MWDGFLVCEGEKNVFCRILEVWWVERMYE